ncbi:MAG: Nif3-like dinuclear metal center hexameric protein [Candidatus Thorarchaeota archaeon]|nr:Nif3-like dinuclear metal center hexameric protein [Candidatus Thorarchaeota archaeon]
MTTLLQIIKRLQELSPREMTIQGLEDRVEIGPQNPTEQANTTINRILIATYPSARVVTKASQDKSNLLVTYRPLFPYVIDRLSGLDLVRVRLLTKNYISSYVMGSGWLCARDGLNDALCDALGVERIGDFLAEGDYGEYVPFGRICKPQSVKNHSGFVNYVASKLNLNTIMFSGDLDDEVGDFLLVAGCHVDMPHIINAKKQDIDTLVTGELAPEIRLLAHEEGINTLELGSFVTEDPGMKRLRDSISLEYPELKVEFMASTQVAHGLRPYKEDMA